MEPDLIHSVSSVSQGEEDGKSKKLHLVISDLKEQVISTCPNDFPKQVTVIRLNDQMRELQTNIRDK